MHEIDFMHLRSVHIIDGMDRVGGGGNHHFVWYMYMRVYDYITITDSLESGTPSEPS